MRTAIDRLSEAIRQKQNPTVLGLDTQVNHLPEEFSPDGDSNREKAVSILGYNIALLDLLQDVVPCVKVQIAYYEMLGVPGMEAFRETLYEVRKRGISLIVDAKRNDIGATAEAYAQAYLKPGAEFEADFLTVNGYLGIDGVEPFLAMCRQHGKGIFLLVKTSNPSSGQLQDQQIYGRAIYEMMGDFAATWGEDTIGQCGYSAVGAVVGATYPQQGEALRRTLTRTFFLVPGYGAQGATGKELRGCFDQQGGGAVVNASRSLLTAHQKAPGLPWREAVLAEALRMKADLTGGME